MVGRLAASRSRVALFLGAGASRACGYPLTADILPTIVKRVQSGCFGDEHIDAHLENLKRILLNLIPQMNSGQLPSITELLSIIDYCIESGEELFPVSEESLSLRETRWLLERAMARVIRKLHRRGMVPQDLVNWVRKQELLDKRVTIISTNYDFSLDRVLFKELGDWNTNYLKTDFGFTWRDPDDGELVHPSSDAQLSLYKLHGSLNWLGCNRCGNIYVNFMRTVVTLADGEGQYSECHCGYRPLRAVLVAPSFVRSYKNRNLLSIWRSASEALRRADQWVFMGYSLPPEDVGIRALLLRSLYSRTQAPRVAVVSQGDAAKDRYQQMFPECEYIGEGIECFLGIRSNS